MSESNLTVRRLLRSVAIGSVPWVICEAAQWINISIERGWIGANAEYRDPTRGAVAYYLALLIAFFLSSREFWLVRGEPLKELNLVESGIIIGGAGSFILVRLFVKLAALLIALSLVGLPEFVRLAIGVT